MSRHDDKLITASTLFLDRFDDRTALKVLLDELNSYVRENMADPAFEMSTLNYYTDLYMKIEERVEFLCHYLDH